MFRREDPGNTRHELSDIPLVTKNLVHWEYIEDLRFKYVGARVDILFLFIYVES